MKHIQLWSIRNDANGIAAVPAASKESTETEAMLEDLLVRSPALLAEGLTLIGRQLPTEGGPLDLLGVDEDGRLVVFELKRGTLTRDAVAQVLDYASDLKEAEPEQVTRLIQDHSGRLGIDKFEDFEDWYSEQYPNSDGLLTASPKMVLVGLGADDRARRMVNFLADSGMDIELLTFHAFETDGKVFLARQIESLPPVRGPRGQAGSATKEGNRKLLHELARSIGVLDLLETAATFMTERMSGYLWPGKTSYTLSLPERTAEGRPTLRAYVALYLDPKHSGTITLSIFDRATKFAPAIVEEILAKSGGVAKLKPKYNQLELVVTPANWPSVSAMVAPLLAAIVKGRATDEDSPAAGSSGGANGNN